MQLIELERQYKLEPSVVNLSRVLNEKMRLGELPRVNVELAAKLGSDLARNLIRETCEYDPFEVGGILINSLRQLKSNQAIVFAVAAIRDERNEIESRPRARLDDYCNEIEKWLKTQDSQILNIADESLEDEADNIVCVILPLLEACSNYEAYHARIEQCISCLTHVSPLTDEQVYRHQDEILCEYLLGIR